MKYLNPLKTNSFRDPIRTFSKYLLVGLAAFSLSCKGEPSIRSEPNISGSSKDVAAMLCESTNIFKLNDKDGRYLFLGRYDYDYYYIGFSDGLTRDSVSVSVFKTETGDTLKSSKEIVFVTKSAGDAFTLRDIPTSKGNYRNYSLSATRPFIRFSICSISEDEIVVSTDVGSGIEQKHSQFGR